ncbi:S-adenosyl-L-methionine-dependent methyltransferase [Annulohypoxylon maeteangense]|uniref:S-adenosyl-L-methionine-dependent methyltransferase n=1 Tax=Annulohypoxylon maeteangense TaxID=1927788 RepID=UPI002008DF6B|nr:S-adenosyl-L-methionine-dependent methyltransferase [Annulohypoxylon maeteangense]KAI0884562.1 S-adenosyl-L-methionine-dependent methyltransferase [Annulohypoxylon maeteangense]
MSEKTFKAYKHEQGTAYAQARLGYNAKFYQFVIDNHTSTGGKLDTVLDVGSGPGVATRGLASHFAHVVGIDASEGMISAARSIGGVSSTAEPIRYEVSGAEQLGSNLDPPIPDSSVDLITAATAAHWFDMSGFWPRAAQVLKPGGSVALWTITATHIHPSTPNHEAIQKAMDNFRSQQLGPYLERGNILANNLYADLPLPWTLEQPVTEFDQSTFIRKEWLKNRTDSDPDPIGLKTQVVDLEGFEKRFETSSPVTRWREAHPDAVGTERDVVRVISREIQRLLNEAGVEKGKERITGNVQSVLLMVKKKA